MYVVRQRLSWLGLVYVCDKAETEVVMSGCGQKKDKIQLRRLGLYAWNIACGVSQGQVTDEYAVFTVEIDSLVYNIEIW